jgi:hypothetical protein
MVFPTIEDSNSIKAIMMDVVGLGAITPGTPPVVGWDVEEEDGDPRMMTGGPR